MSQQVWEYSATCEACGREFSFGLSVPAETIEPASLAQLIETMHGPSCTTDVPTGGRL